MVIVDTTVWVDYFQGTENPQTDWLHAELDRDYDPFEKFLALSVIHP